MIDDKPWILDDNQVNKDNPWILNDDQVNDDNPWGSNDFNNDNNDNNDFFGKSNVESNIISPETQWGNNDHTGNNSNNSFGNSHDGGGQVNDNWGDSDDEFSFQVPFDGGTSNQVEENDNNVDVIQDEEINNNELKSTLPKNEDETVWDDDLPWDN